MPLVYVVCAVCVCVSGLCVCVCILVFPVCVGLCVVRAVMAGWENPASSDVFGTMATAYGFRLVNDVSLATGNIKVPPPRRTKPLCRC